jgi:signal transduction histidine kinase
MAGELHRRGELRWADRLEDGTMQGLVALLLTLRSGLRRADAGEGGGVRDAAEQAVALIDREISDLRGLIAEMRSDRAA